MLVLSRKLGEKILVPVCNVEITVLAVKGERVRLGISAPADLDVFREEIWQRKCQESPHPAPGLPGK